MTLVAVNTQTGQYYKDVAYIRTHEQQENHLKKLRQAQQIRRGDSKRFTFLEMDLGGLEVLSNKELGYYLIMQVYTDYNNVMRKDQNSNIPMTRDGVKDVLKISKRDTVYKLINKFKKHGLLTEEKIKLYGKTHKEIAISPTYSFKKGVQAKGSGRKTDNAVKVFMDELKDVYEQEDITPTGIGFMYKCIPYLDYQSNFLVHNPNETDETKAIFLTLEDLAEIQGISRNKVYKYLTTLVWKNMYCFSRVKVGRVKSTRIKANPMIMYRQAGQPNEKGCHKEFYV